MTPLHWAVEFSRYEIIDYILNHHLDEIDLELVDKFNRTVHEIALIKRNHRVISLIEEKIKIQFNIKSFAKSNSKVNQQRVFNIQVEEEEENLFKLSPPSASLSSSPNSQQMNETLSWLENQIYAQTNTSLNKSTLNNISSIDLLDEIKNGRELVLTGTSTNFQFIEPFNNKKNLI
jgi:hypothetical protein